MDALRQLGFGLLVAGSAAIAGTAVTATPASAGVSVGVSVGVPGPDYYGEYRIRGGRCANPKFAFNHPHFCGYPMYREPVFIDGYWIDEPVYYRVYRGQRYFWWRGGWHVGHGAWDGRRFDRKRDRWWRRHVR